MLSPPAFHKPPSEVAPDTFVVHEVQHALGQPLSVYINSAVVRAEEPVLIDTGSARNRTAWLEDTFSLVDPDDVRWVFVSHEDPDHVGNLAEVMARCPKAILVSSWALTERFTNAFEFPLARCRWLNEGDRIDAGDRQMVLVRPAAYDSPTTRGLLDTTTGVYWAADQFATPVPGGIHAREVADDVAELDGEFWAGAMTMFALHALAPWLRLVDRARFAAEVHSLADLRLQAVISGHSPTIRGAKIHEALAVLEATPSADCPPAPDQAALELILDVMARA